jgi:hypothetical protein
VYEMQKRLEPQWVQHEKEFIRLEVERLWEEIENPETSHRRRSWIGERLDTLGDPRPGVGLVTTTLPLRAEEGSKGIAVLREGEMRLWGDKPEHIGLPDIVWLRVEGGAIAINKQLFNVQPFLIAKYPITYSQFEAFIKAKDGLRDPLWQDGFFTPEGGKRHPVPKKIQISNYPRENVSWYGAIAFCRWLSFRLNLEQLSSIFKINDLGDFSGVRLPFECEWQLAAQGGSNKYKFPWGMNWDDKKSNVSDGGLAHTTAVGMYPNGSAICGALDLSGNIFEWCLDDRKGTQNMDISRNAKIVVRGGSWSRDAKYAGTYSRTFFYSIQNANDIGFRLVVRPPELQG